MRRIYFIWYIVHLASVSDCQVISEDKVFRSDYQYFTEAAGWFKLHQMPVKWQEARLRCAYEGAMLASPTSYGLATVIRNLAAKSKVKVYTGIHATVSNGDFNSLDGIPISEQILQQTLRWLPGNPNNYGGNENCIIYHGDGLVEDVNCDQPHPYICYKKHSEDLVMTECGTTDKKYKMESRVNKCYKMHTVGRPYWYAAAVCSAEGAHLAIINSDEEADVLRSLFSQYPASALKVSYHDSVRVGFYNWNEDSNFFGTLHGQSLAEAGYEKWANGQPTHQDAGRPQRCGGMFRDALFDDTNCEDNLAFICEKDPDSLRTSSIDIKFGQDIVNK